MILLTIPPISRSGRIDLETDSVLTSSHAADIELIEGVAQAVLANRYKIELSFGTQFETAAVKQRVLDYLASKNIT